MMLYNARMMDRADTSALEQHSRYETYERPVNVGIESQIGRLSSGNELFKDVCEDAKINDPERGLYMVADGVGGLDAGDVASKRVTEIMSRRVGTELDEMITNIAISKSDNKNVQTDLIVRSQIRAAVEQAHNEIAQEAFDKESKKMATTASIAKLVEMPEGGQQLYYANVGDSRIYLFRDQQLHQITSDDSALNREVIQGRITIAEARQVDQAVSRTALPEHLKRAHRNLNMVTEVVGGYRGASRSPERVAVHNREVRKGDRVLITSDGVHDTLTINEIRELMMRGLNDVETETAVQSETDSIIKKSSGGRARRKADDISAVVMSVKERGPSREYLSVSAHGERASITAQEIVELQMKHQMATDALEDRLQAGFSQGIKTSEKIQEYIDVDTLKLKQAEAAFQSARAELHWIDQRFPPRFDQGEVIKIWREDFDPPSYDKKRWQIRSYDESTSEYTITQEGGRVRDVSRFDLERQQREMLLRHGDTFSFDDYVDARLVSIDERFVHFDVPKSDGSIEQISLTKPDAELILADQLMSGGLTQKKLRESWAEATKLQAEIKGRVAKRDAFRLREVKAILAEK
jgi:PPM family protein phosphatase